MFNLSLNLNNKDVELIHSQLCLCQTASYSLPSRGCVNNNNNGVFMNNKNNKENRITIRLSNDDFQALSAKLDLSGYTNVSAYVRDYLIKSEPKVKQEVKLDVIEVQRELMNLASMINAAKSRDDLMDQVKKVSRVSLGGAA